MLASSTYQAAPSILYVIIYFVCRCNGVLVYVEVGGQPQILSTLFSETWCLIWLDQLDSEPQGSTCPCLPSAGGPSMHHQAGFFHGFKGTEFKTRVCKVSTVDSCISALYWLLNGCLYCIKKLNSFSSSHNPQREGRR